VGKVGGISERSVKVTPLPVCTLHHIASPRISSVREVNKEMSIRRLAQSILERGEREK